MRLFRRTSWTPKPVPPSPSPAASLRSRINFFRTLFIAEQQRMPSVTETQRRDEEEQRRRADAGLDMIAKAIAERGCWMPNDPR